ncbi:MAG: hypothetical protein ABSD46_02205 [Bacteroidota bacterium]
MPRKVNEVIGIILCFVVVSCNLFKTRTADAPTQVSSTYVPPTDPEKVLQNMVDSFRDKNEVNYLKSFSNASFIFEPAKSNSTYGNVFSSWDKTSEENYFYQLMNKLQQNSYITLTFGTLTTTYFVDSTQVETEYQLVVPLAETNIAKNFKGRAQFVFARDQSANWSIRRWLDIGLNASDSTWSDLKGTFAP